MQSLKKIVFLGMGNYEGKERETQLSIGELIERRDYSAKKSNNQVIAILSGGANEESAGPEVSQIEKKAHSAKFWEDEDEMAARVGLSLVEGIGPNHCGRLIKQFGSAKKVLAGKRRHHMEVPGIGRVLADRLAEPGVANQGYLQMEKAAKSGVEISAKGAPNYPYLLKEISGAPFIIYSKGCKDVWGPLVVSIVGTRTPTGYGKRMAKEIAKRFVEMGATVVSGLATGVDSIVHETVLGANGKTVAVLGHGIGHYYPVDNFDLFQEISKRGMLISDYPLQTKPDPGNFPARNRIIAGLAHATIVIEAGLTGGALITANFAFQQDREVFALPGPLDSVFSMGCHQLIRKNIAKVFIHPDQVLEELLPIIGPIQENRKFSSKQKTENENIGHNYPPARQLNEFEGRLLETIRNLELPNLENIQASQIMTSQEINSRLFALEIKGLISRGAGGLITIKGY